MPFLKEGYMNKVQEISTLFADKQLAKEFNQALEGASSSMISYKFKSKTFTLKESFHNSLMDVSGIK